MSTNATNIVLVHGFWADGSSWSKVIPILRNAGHQVIAVQLPLHSVADDVATVKRALEQLKEPIILVGHSYGGFVITNAAYNNHNVTGLVYVAALAPNEGESLNDLVKTWPKEFLANGVGNVKPDSGGFLFIIPDKFHESFAQDVDRTEADIMAIVQKPPNQSMFVEKSGPPAWKQLRTWFQVSDNDRIIYPSAERNFAERMNATTLSLNSSHASLVSHPGEIAALILNATKGSTK
jgi:pimeloyl-ACP methyl ester carboxylesterase